MGVGSRAMARGIDLIDWVVSGAHPACHGNPLGILVYGGANVGFMPCV